MLRPAVPEDAKQVAPLMILSMGHIAGIFAGSDRYEDAIPFFEKFFTDDHNQYSYAHSMVFEEDGRILGSATGYDGSQLSTLRKPILDEVRKKQPGFTPDDETEAGEYYLDCINVAEDTQGKGIGTKLINSFSEKAASLGFTRVGLIVDFDNPSAREFYEKLSFSAVGEKNFMGHKYFHMVKAVSM